MPYDVWVDEDGLYPPECRCGHPWMGHGDNLIRSCLECPCERYVGVRDE